MTIKNTSDSGISKIVLIYFSATGNTKKYADVIGDHLKKLNISVTTIDITSYSSREKSFSHSDYDAVLFGFPVYSVRAPRVCREWLKKLDGGGMKCAVYFTYGGFARDAAHYFIKELLNSRGFNLVATAEFLASHTFNKSGWEAAVSRPNESDFKVAEIFAEAALNRFSGKDPGTVGPFKKPMFTADQYDMAEQYRFKLITKLPGRAGNNCSMCMLCEKLCPTKAMDAEKGIADPEACIACFRCITNCPDSILHTSDISSTWQNKLAMHHTNKEEIDHMESKIFL